MICQSFVVMEEGWELEVWREERSQRPGNTHLGLSVFGKVQKDLIIVYVVSTTVKPVQLYPYSTAAQQSPLNSFAKQHPHSYCRHSTGSKMY